MQNAANSLPIHGDFVLDSFALMAYLEAEPGGSHVKELLDAAKSGNCHLYMCIINIGEVLYIVEREKGPRRTHDLLARINELPIELVNADRTLTLSAAHLKADCPIAFADCFAAALSQIKNASLVTGDPEFHKLKPEYNVKIEWLASS